ncbi:MAG TPA: von Willebrand factor type A domain-containing protein, partial [Gemmatimonadales bacterium]|nr:von Willebrand factor type A domain-containing protein [Gemmatimonadales bacterium]
MSTQPHRRPIRALLLTALAFVISAAAPRPLDLGRIAGFVKDNAGAPIANAQVFVVGTALSSLTDRQGHYLISGISPGVVDLRAAFVGYRPVLVRGVRVVGGQTALQNFALEASVVEVQAIELTAERPLVPRDQVTSKAVVSGNMTDQLPADRINQVLELQPGVVAGSGEGQVSIRGRRGDERVTYIDGVPVQPNNRGNAYNGAATTNSAIGPTSPPAPNTCCYRQPTYPPQQQWGNTEEYNHIRENGFLPVASSPLSTFSIDVDKASYANVRRFLDQGSLPPADAVRLEEMINYFSYDLPEPRGEHPFSITTDVGTAPWAPEHRLVRVAIQGKRLRGERIPPSNLVFLIDVSGSMSDENKLPLVKRSLRMLVDQLREEDKVTIVVYAGAAGLVLPCTPGTERTRILNAIDNLSAGGSTAGGAGIQLAYRMARQNFVQEGNNRVILATDGDFNVGVSSEGELTRLIEEERRSGVFLTVLGFGTGNYADARMEALADKGNGNYFYVDNIMEGRKVFVEELQGTLFTIAKDVKIQVEFNPAEVAAYRLVGYENRALRNEDFNNDAIDAGELGAGHSVTALYEIIPVGSRGASNVPGVDPLRYQTPERRIIGQRGELMTVKLRYQRPEGSPSRLIEQAVRDDDRD